MNLTIVITMIATYREKQSRLIRDSLYLRNNMSGHEHYKVMYGHITHEREGNLSYECSVEAALIKKNGKLTGIKC